jgi:hypothetical protein
VSGKDRGVSEFSRCYAVHDWVARGADIETHPLREELGESRAAQSPSTIVTPMLLSPRTLRLSRSAKLHILTTGLFSDGVSYRGFGILAVPL